MKSIKKQLKDIGINLVFNEEYEEYQVNFIDGKEATAYYTSDLEDALATGIDMAKRKLNKND